MNWRRGSAAEQRATGARWGVAVAAALATSVAATAVVFFATGGGVRPLTDRAQVVFYPRCSKRVLELIRRSTTEVYLSSHQSSGAAVARALIAAHRRGVRVTVVLDRNKHQDNVRRFGDRKVSIHDPLKRLGARAHLFDVPGFPYLHSKIVLVDGKIVIGSMNVEDRDTQRDNYLIFEDDTLYDRYRGLFERYLTNRSHARNFKVGKRRAESIEAYFGPAPGFLEPILELIRSARASIRICVVDLNHPPLVAALEAAVRRGVTLEIAITASLPRVQKRHVAIIEAAVRLSQAGARVVWHRGGVHHKVMVVDDRVTVTGSPGFETLPLTILYETYLIVDSEGIARKYTDEINHVFNMPGTEDISLAHLARVRARLAPGGR